MELEILYALQSLHTPVLDKFMVFITTLSDHGMIWILLAAVLICLKKTRKLGIAMLLSLALGFLIGNVGLKNLIARPRPCWLDPSVPLLIPVPGDFSFPSGHSLVSFEGAVSIWLVNRKLGSLALLLAVATACSRLYLFVHFPTDVLAGAIIGAAIAWLVFSIQMCYTSNVDKNR